MKSWALENNSSSFALIRDPNWVGVIPSRLPPLGMTSCVEMWFLNAWMHSVRWLFSLLTVTSMALASLKTSRDMVYLSHKNRGISYVPKSTKT